MALDNTNLYYDSSEADNLNKLRIADEAVARAGYLFKDAITKEELIGTMPDNGTVQQKINPGESYTIPEGYHSGKGKVYVGELSEYTQANAIAAQLASNATAWVNGVKIVGTLDVSAAEQRGTAKATDIAAGKTAWVNKTKVTGTVPVLSRQDKTLAAGESYTIPYGIHSGNAVISARSLESQTIGTADANSILKNETAWVNGELITGEFDFEEELHSVLEDTNAEKAHVLAGKRFYSSIYKEIVTGEMPDHTGEADSYLAPGSYYTPYGYYDGQTNIYARPLEDITIASAKPEDIRAGKSAWVNGELVQGAMTIYERFTASIDAGEKVTIPEGYHDGRGYVKGNSLSSQTEANAVAANILSGKTAWVNGVKITGTMPNNYVEERVLGSAELMFIPKGYHPGSEVVRAMDIATQTVGDALPTDLVKDKVAWVGGQKVVGVVPVIESKVVKLEADEEFVIEYGVHDGTGVVISPSVEGLTEATARETDILLGQTAWVNGVKLTGTIPNNSGLNVNLSPGEFYTIPGGYYRAESSYIQAPSVEDITSANATASDIKLGMTAWVNGQLITGTMPIIHNTVHTILAGQTHMIPSGYHDGTTRVVAQDLTSQTQADAIPDNIRLGKSAWVNGAKITGTMSENPAVAIELQASESYNIPDGYHDGNSIIRAATLTSQTQADASPIDILLGKTAWVNGTKVTGSLALDKSNIDPSKVLIGSKYYSDDPFNTDTGTMPNIGNVTVTIGAGESYTIPLGYHNGTGKITAKTLPAETEATAIESQILNGETAWVNGVKITGTMPNRANNSFVDISAGATVDIPEGYYNGTGKITTATLSAQTVGTANASKILYGETAWVNGTKITGTMPNRADASFNDLLAGTTTDIPKGYYDGTGKITTATLSSQTVGTAIVSQILNGKTAWVNGVKITGNMPNNPEVSKTLQAEETYTIPLGYHNGNSVIKAASLNGQTVATAEASDILSGETAWVNGVKITGTMPNHNTITETLQAGQSYTIPLGYHDGTSVITADPLSGQTTGTATAPDILLGETAWVNGVKLTGTMSNNADASFNNLLAGTTTDIPKGYYNGTGKITTATLSSQTAGTADASKILYGETAWVNGTKITGIMPNNTSASFYDLVAGVTIDIPRGYYNGTGKITTATLGAQTVGTADASKILLGETAWVNGVKLTGAMPNRADASFNDLSAGATIDIPEGYYDGTGKITTATLSSQTVGTANKSHILNGKTAWVNGVKITGNMPNNGAVSETLEYAEIYTIPKGYHDGSGTVTAPALDIPGTATAADIKVGLTAWVNGVKLTGIMENADTMRF